MSTTTPLADEVRRALAAVADPQKAKDLAWFFKTGPGEYGEGDLFIGVVVPTMRRVAAQFRERAALADVTALLASPIHEERFTALLLLVGLYEQAKRGPRPGKPTCKAIVDFYLKQRRHINNWDLVDVSAPRILGDWLLTHRRTCLARLARSQDLWERRIAMVSTLALISAGEFADTFRVADCLLQDGHDLIHKATGWMLREVGKRDQAALEAFLKPRCTQMPRTMLRYAIERFPEPLRQQYLRGEV